MKTLCLVKMKTMTDINIPAETAILILFKIKYFEPVYWHHIL